MNQEELHQRILAAFQIEHKEHLEYLRAFLQQGSDPGAPADVDEAFRRAHSLKGAARAADLPLVEKLAHGLETLLARMRRGELPLDQPARLGLSQVSDAIEDITSDYMQLRTPSEPAATLALIAQLLELGPAPEAPLQPAQANVAGMGETVRLQAAHLDHLLQSADLFGTEILRQRQVEQSLKGLGQQLSQVEKQWQQQRKSSRMALQELESQPGFAPIARLMDETQQAFQALTRQVRSLKGLQRKSLWTLGQGVSQLQEAVRQARLVPAENIFQGFRKMVRDLARDQGKSASLKIAGLDIEADRLVLQALKDPVMHLLRNAVTHGIETPSERRRLGKDPAGTVAMQLETVGNRLLLTVEDDGQGCDFGKIHARAQALGLPVAETPSPEDLAQLLFSPGFSTAPHVTDLAGRGMGLSIVRQGVLRLQGEVNLHPRPGAGTCFTLSIPLTAAAHRFILVQAEAQEFAIPLAGISALARYPLSALQTLAQQTTLLHQGEFLPVQSLMQVISQANLPFQAPGQTLNALILRQGSRQAALLVDAFLSEREALLKEIQGPLRQQSLFLGAILKEDGSPILVLHPAQLLEALQSAQPLVVAAESQPPVSHARAPDPGGR